jgi:hypothetical protein
MTYDHPAFFKFVAKTRNDIRKAFDHLAPSCQHDSADPALIALR